MLKLDHTVLAQYMNAAGYTTRAELADAMGVHRSTVTRLLDGKSAPGPAVYSGLRRAFPGKSVDRLLAERKDPR